MTKKKTKLEGIVCEVFIACRNNDTGKEYKPGDTVTDKDFSREVINNWLIIDPPVLGVIDGNND